MDSARILMTVSPDIDLLRDLGIMIVAATLVALLARAVRAPGIVGFLAVGVVLGPATGLLEVTEAIEGIAEAGIIFLLFLLGLELSFKQIRAVGRTAFLVGGAQMALSAGIGFGISLLFGLPALHALFVGLALMYSSTVVVVKLLEKKGDVDTRYGEISVGILLVEDLAVVVVLALVTALGDGGQRDLPLLAEAGMAVAGLLLLVAASVAAARWVLPRLFHWIAHYPEALFIWSLCWCFLFVAAADLLQLAPEVGAFLAGIALAQLPYHHHLHRRVHPLMNFSLAIFFVFLGLQIDPGAAIAEWPLLIALILSVMIGKPLLFMALLARMEHGAKTTFLAALTLTQSSEFSLILGALALEIGLIDESVFSVIGGIALFTMALSAYLIQYNQAIEGKWGHVSRWFGAGEEEDGEDDAEEERKGHIIIVGMTTLAELLAEALSKRDEAFVIVDERLERVESLSYDTVLGNASYEPVLEEAGIARARLLISTIEDEELNSLLVYRCHQHGVACSMHGYDRSILHELRVEGADHLIESTRAERDAVLEALRGAGALGS
jgi:Kef-type K+ transport system membrane component KefB